MMDFEKVHDIIQKCDICLGRAVISDEYIIKSFMNFLTGTVSDENSLGRGIALHIDSPCFMAVAVVWATFATILGNGMDVEQIVRSLDIDDPVIYNNKRGKFKGIENEDGVERACILQGGGIIKVGRISWAKITPYYGESTRYDGRGIRRKTGKREKFLSELLGCAENEIPQITDASVIFVMEKTMAEYYMENIYIRYGKSEIGLAELATASWFTEDREYPLGVNSEKGEVMLKFTAKISVAIDQTYAYDGNECLGIFVCGNRIIEHGITEIPSVMNREKIKFAFICGGMDLPSVKELAFQYESASIYACTKDFLLENMLPVKNKNEYTLKISSQVDTIIDREIEKIQVGGIISWGEYKKFKNAVRLIRNDELDDVTRSEVVIPSYALMKFFMTTAFSEEDIKNAVDDEKMQSYDPTVRLDDLKQKLLLLPDNLFMPGKVIINTLEKLIQEYKKNSPKREYIRRFVRENRRDKKAIIVAKVNHVGIMWNYVLGEYNKDALNLDIVSANRFDNNKEYDQILVVGNLDRSNFDIFHCVSAKNISILLYEPEEMMFNYKSKENAEINHLLNERQKVSEDLELENNEFYFEKVEEIEEISQVDNEMKKYSEESLAIKFDTVVRNEYMGKSSPISEVIRLIHFEDGEGAMLTKQYMAYVVDFEKKEVVQKRSERVEIGDNILFFNRDEDTRDIVDYILKIFIQKKDTKSQIKEWYKMSRQWKEDLLDYMKRTEKTPKEIAEQMLKNGTNVQVAAIQVWLNEDAHIVGPQKKESFYQIAMLTRDEDMLSNIDIYFDACAEIRKIRKKILAELGKAIVKKLQGKEYVSTYIPAELYGRLSTMAIILQIDRIAKVDRRIPSYMTNRPVDFEGGL